jgi:hypothetical protein
MPLPPGSWGKGPAPRWSSFDLKPDRGRPGLQRLAGGLRLGLGDGVAGAADQEGGGVVFAGMDAGGKGVQALDAVGKPLFHKELQRAIGDRGLVAEPVGGQPASTS